MTGVRPRSGSALRPRVGRIVAASVSVLVTAVSLLGGLGVLPGADAESGSAVTVAFSGRPASQSPTRPPGSPATTLTPVAPASPTPRVPAATRPGVAAVPPASGSGQRAVFSIRQQRVWLIDPHGRTVSTYLVSGSLTHNLLPGHYRVSGRERAAIGVDDSGRMRFFVIFAHGRYAAIGFHSIPTKAGRPVQSLAQLGTPLSHGCIRQRLSDARRMWRFAAIGTSVVVVA